MSSEWHGTSFSNHPEWQNPKCAAQSSEAARPGYQSAADINASEFLDQEDTLNGKLETIADMLLSGARRERTVVYSGAGLSTSTGIGDYASKAKGSVAPHLQANGFKDTKNRLQLQPTMGHHALAAMHRLGVVHHWLQQNHDRLAQKAGFPQDKLNEIHGAWGDMKNPVLSFCDPLRPDLLAWMEEWEEKVEICLTVGTSICGMRADSITDSAAAKGGLVIIGLSATNMDEECAVRVWGLLDVVLPKLYKVLMRRKRGGNGSKDGSKEGSKEKSSGDDRSKEGSKEKSNENEGDPSRKDGEVADPSSSSADNNTSSADGEKRNNTADVSSSSTALPQNSAALPKLLDLVSNELSSMGLDGGAGAEQSSADPAAGAETANVVNEAGGTDTSATTADAAAKETTASRSSKAAESKPAAKESNSAVALGKGVASAINKAVSVGKAAAKIKAKAKSTTTGVSGGSRLPALPDPICLRSGKAWDSKHPGLRYNTPIRRKK